jgi:glyoxylase I family protein
MQWSHVGLNCADQAATEAFYTRWFGFRRARVVRAGAEEVIFLKANGVYLELFPTAAPALVATEKDGPQHAGLVRHLAFQVDSVDGFLAQVGDELTVTLGPLRFDEFIPGWKTVWVSDPDGVVVEVSQGYTDQTPEELAAV